MNIFTALKNRTASLLAKAKEMSISAIDKDAWEAFVNDIGILADQARQAKIEADGMDEAAKETNPSDIAQRRWADVGQLMMAAISCQNLGQQRRGDAFEADALGTCRALLAEPSPEAFAPAEAVAGIRLAVAEADVKKAMDKAMDNIAGVNA